MSGIKTLFYLLIYLFLFLFIYLFMLVFHCLQLRYFATQKKAQQKASEASVNHAREGVEVP